jgi:Ca2+-transporting ATPase
MIRHKTEGLTTDEVVKSRATYGQNIITPSPEQSPWQLLLDKFRDPIIIILLMAAILSLGMAIYNNISSGEDNLDFTETIGILCAVLLATCVGFLFEWDALRRFRELNQVNDNTPVKVRRNGVVIEIPRHEVVVGDIVIVETGEYVPADGRLIEAISLTVDESTLTGETETFKYANESEADTEATYASNLLLRGTNVTDGYGVMEVSAVGDNTEAGKVNHQSTLHNNEVSPLYRQLSRLSKQIGAVGIFLSALIFIILVGKHYLLGEFVGVSWSVIASILLKDLMIVIAMLVMAVPEGLPMSITLSLALSMRRMLKTNNLVRKMHACETMGAVTVICTDKTGTLTCNSMRVEQLLCYDTPHRLLGELLSVNSTAFLSTDGDTSIGNPTEGALLKWLCEQGYSYETLRNEVLILDRLTFTTERKYMATLIERRDTQERLLLLKGAPEVLISRCINLPDGYDEFLASQQQQARRTLAICYVATHAEHINQIAESYHLAALVALTDPIREEVPAAIKTCVASGIKIKIVTGDNSATAIEVARRIGWWNDNDVIGYNSMTGVEFATMDDKTALERISSLKVLARAKPFDKQRLVQLLQQQGEVVAVTGDGTNDAPALNFANVGLSMGSGTSIAKSASDITLLDDSFQSIVTAIQWGRSLYRNIQRFILFQLTVNFTSIVVFLVGTLCETVTPLTVTQILWINLIMDTLAAMAMASLPPRPEVMNEQPRKRDAHIVSQQMGLSIISYGLISVIALLGLMLKTWDDKITTETLTVFFTTFVFLQFWNLFNAKGFGSDKSSLKGLSHCHAFLGVMGVIAVVQWMIVQWGGEVFRTTPLSGMTWVKIIVSTSLIAVFGELTRYVHRRKAISAK